MLLYICFTGSDRIMPTAGVLRIYFTVDHIIPAVSRGDTYPKIHFEAGRNGPVAIHIARTSALTHRCCDTSETLTGQDKCRRGAEESTVGEILEQLTGREVTST